MESFGANPERTFEATNTVDVEQLQASLPSKKEHTDDFELLYCGQLIERKNVGTVIDALNGFEPDEFVFRIVGDGPARDSLEAEAEKCSTPVHFEGYVERDELPIYYADADALVLPSWREVWGLVVNESLACGTPAVVSTQCGCASDLIRPGFNGATFDPANPDELCDILQSEIETSGRAWASADEIRTDAIERFNIEQATDAFESAIRAAVKT
jgi:glycosyltransferase involved in cell wall biosynthesis